MSEALEAGLKKLGDTGQPEVVREIIASRIIAAARLGERSPVRLLEAALCGRTFFRRFSSVCAQSQDREQ